MTLNLKDYTPGLRWWIFLVATFLSSSKCKRMGSLSISSGLPMRASVLVYLCASGDRVAVVCMCLGVCLCACICAQMVCVRARAPHLTDERSCACARACSDALGRVSVPVCAHHVIDDSE